jgi:hypothetical protein
MAEDLDDHRRIFYGGEIFKAPPQFEQCLMSMSKNRLSKRTQLMRAGAPSVGA